MPEKEKVSKRSIAEQSVKAIADWATTWSRAEAVAMLCIPETAYLRSDNNLSSRVISVLEAAFLGQSVRLREDQDLAKHEPPLADVVDKVRSRMKQLELQEYWSMYPVLWIRLLLEASVAIEPGAYRRLGEWRLRSENDGAVVFALAKPSAKDGERPALRVPNTKIAEVQGWTVEELLLPVGHKSKWPFHRTWTLRTVARGGQAEASALVSGKLIQSAAAPVSKKSRRKRKTLQDFQALCGSGVMESLAKTLRQEAKSGRGYVLPDGDGRYRTELSAAELLRKLRRFQPGLIGADSTLQKAFAAYMTLPRGRPQKSRPVEGVVKRKPR